MKSGTQQSLVDRLLDQYEQFGIMPIFSGGDDDAETGGDDSKPDDGDRTGEKRGRTSDSDDRKKSGDFKPITSQDELDALLIKRLKRQEKSLRTEIEEELREEAKAEAAKKEAEENGNYKKLYEESQAEVEKLLKKLDEKDAEVKQRTLDELRQGVIDEFKLPKDLADRLHGETEEELKADAKKLSEVIVPREAPDIDTGKSSGGDNKKKKGDKVDEKDPNYWGLPT